MTDSFISQAVILAAGKGTRMGAATEQVPKPMLPIHGRPMLEHILDGLKSVGIEHFLIVVGYHGELIQQHFEKTNPPIEFVRQNPVNGTGSAALLARGFARNQPFLLTFGDILCDPADYTRCIRVLADNPNVAAAIAVKSVDDPWQGAAVYETDGRIEKMIEKPPQGSSTTHWNSAGFYGFRPVIFDYLARVTPSPRGEYELTAALDSMLDDGLDLRISAVEGDWRDVGRPDDLAAMNA